MRTYIFLEETLVDGVDVGCFKLKGADDVEELSFRDFGLGNGVDGLFESLKVEFWDVGCEIEEGFLFEGWLVFGYRPVEVDYRVERLHLPEGIHIFYFNIFYHFGKFI
jgi:hypothetical protein